MDMIIRVSFKQSENQLYQDILVECNIVGQSAWMKLAAIEKLQRDKLPNINVSVSTPEIITPTNVNNTTPKQNNKLPIISELTELFNQ